MCGIALIVSGVAFGGHPFSSQGESAPVTSSEATSQPVSKVAETAQISIEDICLALSRRGPDHLGGTDLYLWSSKQHLETWQFRPPDFAVNRSSQNGHPLECAPRFERCEAVEGNKACIMASDSKRRSEQPSFSDIARLRFVGATLQLRGDHSVTQPLQDSLGNVLVFNGEVFGGLAVRPNENDSEVLMGALHGCCECVCHGNHQTPEFCCSHGEPHQTVPQVLSRLRGPWALIYWQAASQVLWFGRDAIGRRSLLIHQPSPEDPHFLLTSVAPGISEGTAGNLNYWEELPCGIYSISFSVKHEGKAGHGPLHHASVEAEICKWLCQESLNGWIRMHSWQDPWLATLHVSKRCQVAPSDTSSQNLSYEEGKPKESSKDQTSHTFCLQRDGYQRNTIESGQDAIDRRENHEQKEEGRPVERVLFALRQAVQRRTVNITSQWRRSQSHTDKSESTQPGSMMMDNTPVAVLFSGGLDSMILAALADQFVNSNCCIDLLNVSFDGDSAPDRVTAITGVAELREVFPSRRWRLIGIDAQLSDLAGYHVHLQSLIWPSNTYMDLNIGTALWLAASGEGHVWEAPLLDASGGRNAKAANMSWSQGLVQSEARVLLVGSGADEQCGGYGRHRTKFRAGGIVFFVQLLRKGCVQIRLQGENGSCSQVSRPINRFLHEEGALRDSVWESLEAEMRLDFTRIWRRNLGRDDRCISDQGKEARFPFLDEDVVSAILSLPLWEITDLRQPAGIGDKKILRQVAEVLGLKGAATLPKRAIQFGSRIAQESNLKNFGSNRAANQASAGSVRLKSIG